MCNYQSPANTGPADRTGDWLGERDRSGVPHGKGKANYAGAEFDKAVLAGANGGQCGWLGGMRDHQPVGNRMHAAVGHPLLGAPRPPRVTLLSARAFHVHGGVDAH